MDKKILLTLFIGMFMISLVSAFTFDDVITYSNDDLKVTFNDCDFWLLTCLNDGELIGSAELKSHSSVEEIKKVGFGKEEVVMYYDFTYWELYPNGLGEVIFTDMRTGKEIEKDYYFVEWKEVEVDVNDHEIVCEKDFINGTKGICNNKIVGSHKEMEFQWVEYKSLDIPAKDLRIGLKTYVGRNDYIDGVWTIAGKEVTKHITWAGDLDGKIAVYWKMDEAGGDLTDEVGNIDLGNSEGSPAYSKPGIINTAIEFDAALEGFTQAGGADLTTIDFDTTDDFAVNFWVNSSAIASVSAPWIIQTNILNDPLWGFGFVGSGTKILWRTATTAAGVQLISDGNFPLNEYQMITAVRNNSGQDFYLFFNNVLNQTALGQAVQDAGAVNISVGSTFLIDKILSAGVDEFVIFNDSLSGAEIEFFWNNGNACAYGDNSCVGGGVIPVVTLETPNNFTNFTTNEVDFECFVYDYVNALANVSFILDGVVNETINTPVNASSNWFNDSVLSEGNHTWTCIVYSNISESFTADTFVLNVDTTPNIVYGDGVPVDHTNQTTNSFEVNVTLTEGLFKNVTFDLYNANGGLNQTETFTNATRSRTWINLPDATYSYNVTTATTTNLFNNTATRNISIDTTNPVVSASNLTNLVTTSLPINSTWFFNASDTNIDLCYYNSTEDANYQIITCNSTITDLEWTTGGNKTIQFCANDTFTRETCNTEYIWIYSITETQADNPDPIGEGSTATFNFTINLTNIGVTTATLMINNTIFSPTITTAGTNGYYFEKTLVIPNTWGNTTGYPMDWSWNYTITGVTTNATTDITNITIYELAVDNCTLYSQEILNLSLRDEEGNSVIDPLVYNTTVEIEINITSLVDPSIFFEYSYTFNNETNPRLCVPFNLINDTNYTTDITVGFDSTDHVWEFWHLDDGIISIAGDFNNHTDTNVALMDLLTTDSTSFLFNYFDLDGQAIDGSIVHVFRKYIGDGIFLEVERSQADENGDTIVHLVEEDVIYYFEISLAGVILYTSSTYTALCQAVPCTINLEEGGESAEFDTDYDLIEGGGYSINSSITLRLVSLVYELEDPATINFTLYRYESDGSYLQVNTSIDTDTSGILTLYVPLSAGNVSFFASVVKDNKFINSEWIDFSGQAIDEFGIALSIFLGAILILTLGLMAISSGAVVLVWVMVGIVVSGAFGLFATKLSTGVSVVIYLICAGGLLLWKLTGGRK